MAYSDVEHLASIEYGGVAGVTRPCVDAVLRYIQFGEVITKAQLLTHQNDHGLLLHCGEYHTIGIKSGFASGYGGEGPNGLSYVLEVLEHADVEIEEYVVDEDLMLRLDYCALTRADIETLETARPVRPIRYYDYILDHPWKTGEDLPVWRGFPAVIPYVIVDPRIIDRARGFWLDPDKRIMTGYRRLEDTIRERIKVADHGSKLFSVAFSGEKPLLRWPNVDKGEQNGRASMFTGTYQGFRNRRAHRELKDNREEQLSEFLLLNQLYLMERDAFLAP